MPGDTVSAHVEYTKALIAAGGTVTAALIAAAAGAVGAMAITGRLQKRRNEQDRESQWRSHAIELTKLDAERLLKRAGPEGKVRPFILAFLANYRDLQELGSRTPGELYEKIVRDRIKPSAREPTVVLSEHAPSVIACAGSQEGGGHPRVYLTVSTTEAVICPYCSRAYLLAADHEP